ncbi:achaete-scute complex protein T3 [Drosophila grimshawi]|uniref:GH24341 n=1 Tax=Drosophila grimshawi TaxID=7222 RepID=B4JMG0_DROGR|nr:achaete-scute complex protein T3 [Drosophila grimshawi]EDV91903.1 GH24341 [Drosophila grimshawi]
MTSICSSYQHFQLTNGNIMLLHQQQQQLQQQLLLQQQQQHQLIAPKQPLGNSQLQNMQQTTNATTRSASGSGVGPMLAKKKYNNYSNMPYGGAEQMPSVARRNARERNRVKQVNNGFVNLRQHLPQTVINSLSNGGRGASKKLSKVDTLRIAVEYIRGLQDMLGDDGQPRAQLLFSSSSTTDECSNDSYNDDYNDSLDSPPTASAGAPYHHHHSYHSASPTPSYSDASDLSASYVKQELPDQEQQQQQQQQEQQQFKFESFDSFSDEQPDDEELLDYISSWQEQ